MLIASVYDLVDSETVYNMVSRALQGEWMIGTGSSDMISSEV